MVVAEGNERSGDTSQRASLIFIRKISHDDDDGGSDESNRGFIAPS